MIRKILLQQSLAKCSICKEHLNHKACLGDRLSRLNRKLNSNSVHVGREEHESRVWSIVEIKLVQ